MLGKGLIKGLAETARNFVGSYSDPERLVTVEYPEERLPLKENTRNFPFLVFDGDDAQKGLRCVACKICEKECPPQCIYIVLERDAFAVERSIRRPGGGGLTRGGVRAPLAPPGPPPSSRASAYSCRP